MSNIPITPDFPDDFSTGVEPQVRCWHAVELTDAAAKRWARKPVWSMGEARLLLEGFEPVAQEGAGIFPVTPNAAGEKDWLERVQLAGELTPTGSDKHGVPVYRPVDLVRAAKESDIGAWRLWVSYLVDAGRTGAAALAADLAAVGNEIPATITHRIQTRATPLTAEIDKALEMAADPEDLHCVWTELVKLAEAEYGCLLLSTNEGIKYRGSAEGTFFTKDALKSRLYRKKNKKRQITLPDTLPR